MSSDIYIRYNKVRFFVTMEGRATVDERRRGCSAGTCTFPTVRRRWARPVEDSEDGESPLPLRARAPSLGQQLAPKLHFYDPPSSNFEEVVFVVGKSRDRCFVGYEYGFFALLEGGSDVSACGDS